MNNSGQNYMQSDKIKLTQQEFDDMYEIDDTTIYEKQDKIIMDKYGDKSELKEETIEGINKVATEKNKDGPFLTEEEESFDKELEQKLNWNEVLEEKDK